MKSLHIPRSTARALACALIALLMALPSVSMAQSGADKAAAEALFRQGKDLLDQKSYAAACDKLAASQKLEAAAGTLLYLGECNEQLGKKASAWASFREAESLAERQGDAERKNIASVRATALEPQVSKLSVRVAQPVEGLTVRRNGVELPPATWGSALPVDAGEQRIEATAPNKQPWMKAVTVTDGGSVISVDVPLLADAAASAPPPPPPPQPGPLTQGAPTPSSPKPGADSGSASGLAVVGLITMGVGVVGIGVGSAFGLMASSSNDESLDHCRTETLCSPTGLELRDDADSQAATSTILFALGGVLAAGGLTMFLLAPSGDERATTGAASDGAATISVSAGVGPGQAGLVLRGQF